MPLELLRSTRTLERRLPPFIPLGTHELPEDARLGARCVGADLDYLLTRHTEGAAELRPWVRTRPEAVRRHLRVGPETELLAVLNAKDDRLEPFWGSDRPQLARELVEAGFTGATGPTFSIYGDHPSSHHVCMLLRHHRSVHDLQTGGLAVAPNLYWRDHRDRESWVEWLERERDVGVVSRDFSRTKDLDAFRKELAGIVEILKAVQRPFHVLATGVGLPKVHTLFCALGEIGSTGSIISSRPVVMGKNGRGLHYRGVMRPLRGSYPMVPSGALAAHNIRVADAYVRKVVGINGRPLAVTAA